MTKQQEIRNGIEDVISDKGYYFPVGEATEDILAYLDGKGVVIKGALLTFEGKPVGFEVEPLVEK